MYTHHSRELFATHECRANIRHGILYGQIATDFVVSVVSVSTLPTFLTQIGNIIAVVLGEHMSVLVNLCTLAVTEHDFRVVETPNHSSQEVRMARIVRLCDPNH